MSSRPNNLLGAYLRDRRARLDPAAFGLSASRRRTPGLRREEVAQRANISPTWYAWLEQGRGGAINRPLQVALDLWQASAAEYPCAAFDSALEVAAKEPDSYITGTLRIVPVPMMPDATPCPESPDTLRRVREQYDEMYAGIDSNVPAHYRPKAKRR